MLTADLQRVREAWAAFASGDIDAATSVLDKHVHWHAAGDPDADGACHSREQASAFIRRALAEGVKMELLDVRDAGDNRLVVIVHPHWPDEERGTSHPHGEVVTVLDGKITEMVVYPTVDDALAAAELPTGG